MTKFSILGYAVLVLAVVLPLFCRPLLIRVFCVGFVLVAVFFAVLQVEVSSRRTVDRFQMEGKPWTDATRDASLYTRAEAWTGVPIIVLSALGLGLLAILPVRKP